MRDKRTPKNVCGEATSEGVCNSEIVWFLADIAAAMFANKNNSDTLLRELNCLFVCLFFLKQDVV